MDSIVNSPVATLAAPRGDVRDAPLGITAKSSSSEPLRNPRLARAEKYRALAQARVWLGRRANMLKPDEPFPGNVFRTFDCRFVRIERNVVIRRNTQHKSAFYTGLVTCGSVWACPLCAGKIQERRRLELEHLVQWSESQNLQAIMVTLTFPHKSFHTLGNLLDMQRDAFKRLRSGSVFSDFKKSIGFRGLVRSLEVTHGQNGWHPHTHELWLVDPSVTDQVRLKILAMWEKACVSVGLLDPTDELAVHSFRLRSVDVRLNADCGAYLAKQDSSRNWGITHEVAKASSKSGRAKGVHPHEFLVRAAKGDEALYFEYLNGMKGKAQLYWSPRLKSACGLADFTDDQLAVEAADDSDDELAQLCADEWAFIQKKRLIARVLDAAEIGGYDLISRYLKKLGYVHWAENYVPADTTYGQPMFPDPALQA